MRSHQTDSGYVLLVAMLALVAMMLLVMGAIQFTGANRVNAITKARGDQATSCVQTAKRMALSKLSLHRRIPVEEIQLDHTLPDSTNPAQRSRAMTAHLGDTNASFTIRAIDVGMGPPKVHDMTNVLPSDGGLGGRYYLAVVKCREANGREAETEFVFRYGY